MTILYFTLVAIVLYIGCDRLLDALERRAGLESLSEREQEVFLRLARGETPKQAAIDMGISDKTVYLHRASLRAKLGVNNDLALHKLALERGLLG